MMSRNLVLLASFTAACLPEKGDDLGCGPGTHEEDGLCVADEADGDTGDPTGGSGGSGGSGGGDTDVDGGDSGDSGGGFSGGSSGGSGGGSGGSSGGGDTGTTVDATVCDDGMAPYDNLQDAVNDASNGDTITVCAGTWEAVEVSSVSVSLVGPYGADLTIIDGGADYAVLVDGETVQISGFTLRSSLTASMGAALYLNEADVTLHDVNITENYAATLVYAKGGSLEWDGGVIADNDLAWGNVIDLEQVEAATLRHLLIRNNSTPSQLMSYWYTNAVLENSIVSGNTSANQLFYVMTGGMDNRIVNNVFHGNTATWSSSPNYLIQVDGAVSFYNNILVGNSDERLLDPELSMGYNAIYDNTASIVEVGGSGNVLADPDFVDAAGDDFALAASSPCIDAGNPSSSYDDVDGSPNDIGAYGGPSGGW